MLKIKMACGFAVMVCALAALASPSFALTEFTGKQGKIVKSSEQVLAVATGVEVKCLSVTGGVEKESKEQVKTATLTYKQCVLGGQAAIVANCNFHFHIHGFFRWLLSLIHPKCQITSGGCELTIEEDGNEELKEVSYTSLGTEKSEFKINGTGITAIGSGKSSLCAGLKTKVATYKGTMAIEGIGVT